MTPDKMKIWPDEKPESASMDKEYLIWLPDTGYQITRYSYGNGKAKKPYFYWCGSPKKVWWIELK